MKQSIFVGERYESNSHGWVVITKYVSCKEVYYKFEDTGYEGIAEVSQIKGGRLSDKLKPTLCGIGYLGVGSYPTKINNKKTRCYNVWSGIIKRCFGKKVPSYKRYGARGVTVCEEWHNFSNFAAWYEQNYKDGYQIDKDILKRGNKVYCPQFCRFVPSRVNGMVCEKRPNRGEMPQGVYFNWKLKKYSSRINTFKGQVHFGCYNTPEEAFKVYKDNKEKHIRCVAQDEFDKGRICEDIYKALMSWDVVEFPERVFG